ncbi:MAG TPA: NAD(P)/FAD-dependent oxidoreductase [Pirellulales bacterium]|jgi:geranylgeranyl reductase family protein|nr:NAD(P)/FAD-dependent oxidoreductase [Pirellulales bacterium]
MQRCDVLIVGGGPAGSTCAQSLRAAGADVVVLDKKVFPREKPCAGWITPQVIETLKLDIEAYCRTNVFQPLTGFRTGMMSGREVATHYERAVSFGIRRYEFDRYLLERSGAKHRLGEALKSLDRAGDRWIVNGQIDSALVVGAGGHFCPIAQRLGARLDRTASVVAAQEVEFEASPSDLADGRIDPEIPELFFCDDLKGYGWCFRKGNFLNIGLGRVESREVSRHVSEFCRMLHDRGKICGEIPSRFHGHAYQLYERTPPKLIDDGALLIGDAAGLAYPHSGEGIRPAVESGAMAAEAIAAAAGDYSAAKLDSYRQRVVARYGAPRANGPTDWLPAGWLHSFAARLMASRWFARKVVLDRWFLHAREPALNS